MKIKSLIIAHVIFIVAAIAFALYWNTIYDAGPDEQKGDYIFYCLKITVLLTFLYLVLVKLSVRKLFPTGLLFITPIISCFVSVMLALGMGIIAGETGDTSILQLYLFIHGFCAVGFVYLMLYFAKKSKANI